MPSGVYDRRTSEVDQFEGILVVGRADIDLDVADILGREFLALLLVHQVRGAHAEDPVDRSLLALDHYALGGDRGNGDAPEGTHVEKTLVIDVLHHEADLVTVAFNHDAQRRVPVRDGMQVSVHIQRHILDTRFLQVFPEKEHAVLFKTGRGGQSHEALQQIKRFLLHNIPF